MLFSELEKEARGRSNCPSKTYCCLVKKNQGGDQTESESLTEILECLIRRETYCCLLKKPENQGEDQTESESLTEIEPCSHRKTTLLLNNPTFPVNMDPNQTLQESLTEIKI